jgi:hypothetical protein
VVEVIVVLQAGARLEAHPSRAAWSCIALAPVGYVVALLLALFAGAGDTGTDAWMGGVLLTVVALLAPVAAVVEAERATHSTEHAEIESAHHVIVIAWILLAATIVAIPLTLVALESFFVGAVVVGVGTAIVVSLQRHDGEEPPTP